MQVFQLSAASVLLAAMTVMAEGAWADPAPAASGAGQNGHAPVHKTAYHRKAARRAPADQADAAAPSTFQLHGESRFEPAPTPDDESAPSAYTTPQITTEPHMFAVKTQFRGDGFPYGATQQGLDNNDNVKVPGALVTLPLMEQPGTGIR